MLSLQDGVNDARQFFGDSRERDQLVFAMLALVVINALEHCRATHLSSGHARFTVSRYVRGYR
jgi:hypothetical protein